MFDIPDQFTQDAHDMVHFTTDLQSRICEALEKIDSSSFLHDKWSRDGGGGGLTCVLNSDHIFEKAGVNTSQVFGVISEKEAPMFSSLLTHQGYELDHVAGLSFFATGISIVIHPRNPFIPTTHMNYRYFELNTPDQPIWWYGGGADLTPYYLDDGDATHFHRTYKSICDKYDETYYPTFKEKCDRYFYLPHRNETRGIGGIFFDYLKGENKEILFDFLKDCGNGFLDAYLPIVHKHKERSFSQVDKQWQKQRRGRYVEFNLLYDRGTLFGLKTGGRVESILMSLPSDVAWVYQDTLGDDEEKKKLYKVLSQPRDWV